MSPGAEERPVSSKIWRGFGHRGPETRLKPLFEKDPEGPWPDVRHPHPGLKGRVYYASRLAAEAVLWSARIQDNQTGFFLEWGSVAGWVGNVTSFRDQRWSSRVTSHRTPEPHEPRARPPCHRRPGEVPPGCSAS